METKDITHSPVGSPTSKYGVGPKAEAKVKPVTVAEGLLRKGLKVAKGAGRLYFYDETVGKYTPGTGGLRHRLTVMLGEDWAPSIPNTVITYLRDIALDLWETPPLDRVNVLNGILNIDTMALEPHSPDFLSPVQLGADWDPEAECPEVQKFLDQVFPADAVPVAFELIGYLCLPDNSLQVAFLLVGEGANGKSTFLNMVTKLLGPDNISNFSLHDLGSNRFAPAELQGKLANISADIPNRHLADVSLFKAIVGGDSIMAERKYGDSFQLTPFSRLLFSANEIPTSPDVSKGYQRRWKIVPFPNMFGEADQDRGLLDKLTTPKEMSGLLNMAIHSYKELRARGVFKLGDTMRRAHDEFVEAIDPVAVFIREKTRVASDASDDKTALYKGYKGWCDEVGHKPLSARKFNLRIRQHIPGIAEKKVNGRPHWVGISGVENEAVSMAVFEPG
jgi:putative DNA primase/helicase